MTTNSTDVNRTIRKYYEELYGYKFDNIDEMEKILNLCNLSQFTKKETNNLNSHIRDIEYIVKAFPQNKTQCP